MAGPKITVIGAGSYFFGKEIIHKMASSEVLHGGTLALVDTNPDVLATMRTLAERVFAETGAGVSVEAATDRLEVLPGSDFVVLTFADRNAYFRGVDTQIAAKHGILGLTKTVALEAAEFGVTCNSICPGYVRTPLVEKQIPDTAKARGITEEEVVRDVMLAPQPTKQFVTTEQLGALAVFLCTDGAASITGTALPVDGGWTSQ